MTQPTKPLLAVLVATLLAISVSLFADDTEPKRVKGKFVNLFNGKNLDNWEQHGGKAVYTIEGDEIVGTTVANTPNSFLCTKLHYEDFILEFEFKVDPTMNSGVQFRSLVFDKPTEVVHNEKTIKIPVDRVHGYQYEIDPSARAWTAGVYDEGRRGWLFDLKNNQTAGKAFKQNEWNKAKIECQGDSIKTYINGVPAADFKDAMTTKGLIALQVHSIGKDKMPGTTVRWRKLRIKEL